MIENKSKPSKVITETVTEENKLATVATFTQADIPSLLETVNKKISELSKTSTNTPKIEVPLPGFGHINQLDSVLMLLQACSNVEGKAKAYKAAALKYLPEGIKAPEFRIAGHTEATWLEVIQIKIAEVAHKKELEKLKSVKATLESNLSQEMKLANDLKKISQLLNEE